DDRPRRPRGGDRPPTARVVGPSVRGAAPGAGRRAGGVGLPTADPPLEAPGSPRLGGRDEVWLRDGPDLRRDPSRGGRAVEFRVVPRGGADEQRGGARLAPCG